MLVTTRTFRSAIVGLAVVVSLAAFMATPRTAFGASKYPTHYANMVLCWGAGELNPTRQYVEVPAPVIWAYNPRPGMLDKQYVTWRADLLIWNGSSWTTKTTGAWATPYITYDGDGIAPEFDWAALALRGTRLAVPQLNRFYTIRITVHWYQNGAAPTAEDVIIPGTFLEPADGWLASPGLYCDYTPDVGYIPLP